MSVRFGPVPKECSDEEVFAQYNDGLLATRAMRLRNPYFAQEIPAGKPQLRREGRKGPWSMVGDVLRGVVEYGDAPEDVVFEVDDHDLNLTEFAELFSSLSGWGFRLVIVPGDELLEHPRIKVGTKSWGHRESSEKTEDLKDSRFTGEWQITRIELLPTDELDLLGPAHFYFDRNGEGRARFAMLKAELGCCQYGCREGRPSVDFSWNGSDGGARVNGRGWAWIQEDGTLEGHFLIQGGEATAFWAKKPEKPASAPTKHANGEGNRNYH